MRGSIIYQVHKVFDSVKAFGQSKHEAKEQAREHIEQNNWHNVGKQLDVYSYRTADQYRDVWKEALLFAKENYRIRGDIEKLNSEHITSYLKSKIADGIKYGTFQTYAAALEKLEVALNRYAQLNNTSNTYKFNILDVRKEAQQILERTNPARAYEDPQKLINSMKDDTFKILASAQYTGGFRVSELNYISIKNFLDNNTFLVTNSKGGLRREVELPEKVYNDLKTLVLNANGKFVFNADKYREELKQASNDTNQIYNGSHGLRWNYAQEKFFELQKAGYGYEQTLSMVSEALGHHRGDITEHYLKI